MLDLASTVLVPALSGHGARARVVRHGNPASLASSLLLRLPAGPHEVTRVVTFPKLLTALTRAFTQLAHRDQPTKAPT